MDENPQNHGGLKMIYTVEFYSEAHGEVLTRAIEAPNRNMAVDGICKYYRVGLVSVRSVKETPDAEPKFQICKVSRIPGNNK